MKQFTVVVCSLLMVLLAGALVAAEEYKIGYVDLQRALNESSAGKQAKEKFTAEVKRAESDILRRKDEVEKLGASLENRAPCSRMKRGQTRKNSSSRCRRTMSARLKTLRMSCK